MKRFIRPRRLKDEVVFTEEELPVFEYTPDGERIKKEKQVSDLAPIPSNLDEVVETFKGIFGDGSKDFVMRRIRLSLKTSNLRSMLHTRYCLLPAQRSATK